MKARSSGAGHSIAAYEISDREMAAGSTFGAPKTVIVIKATGAIEKLYSVDAGKDAFGALVLHHWDETSGIPLAPAPGHFHIHPSHQDHLFTVMGGVRVSETLFVLNARSGEGGGADRPAAYYCVELRNDGEHDIQVATYASIRLRGGCGKDTSTAWDNGAHAFVVHNAEQPDFVRIAACSVRPDSYEVTLDSAKTSAAGYPGELSNRCLDTSDDPIGIFHIRHRLKRGACERFFFVLTFSLDGERDARDTLKALPDAEQALDLTRKHFAKIEQHAVVLTPEPEVNRGVLWAKANMLRSQLFTSQGWCFVNDPSRSNNSVARDTAWFGFGSDYVTPAFAAESNLWFIEHLEERGMVVEYFDVRNGRTEDDGLNINDDTPLIILALWHHYNISGDTAFLQRAYPNAKRAGDYILSQRNGQGLVWCNAAGTADRGIIGWRNVIKGYRLSGATTEANSECYAALRTLGMMARELGLDEDAGRFAREAQALRDAINEHLLDKRRKLYYLNIDLDGTPRTDVTSDLVFPVMFGVADHDVAANVIARLSTPEFWSDAGLHTVPRTDINYSPTAGYGLMGGVWAGPTFWFAYAAAAFNAEFMAFALASSFRHYSQDPRKNNTVPGQFSEWLHGETLTNQGMMMSPWFPPKYLWAAIEGAGGLNVLETPPRLEPHPPASWLWMGVRDVKLRGKIVSWFVVSLGKQVVYCNYPFDSVEAEQRYDDDVSSSVHVTGEDFVRIALRRSDRIAVFVGNTREHTSATAVHVDERLTHGTYKMRTYNTLRGEWTEQRGIDGAHLAGGVPIQVNGRGFCVIELHVEA